MMLLIDPASKMRAPPPAEPGVLSPPWATLSIKMQSVVVTGHQARRPPPKGRPSVLLSPPWDKLPLNVLLVIVALLPPRMAMPPPAASPNLDAPAPPSAWLPVIWQPVMVRVPPKLATAPPRP